MKQWTEERFLKIAAYGCVGFAIFLEMKRLFYASEMWAYTEAAFVFLMVAALFLLMRALEKDF